MLVLTRKRGEAVVLRVGGVEITVTVPTIAEGRCRLGIAAPQEVTIIRKELEDGPSSG